MVHPTQHGRRARTLQHASRRDVDVDLSFGGLAWLALLSLDMCSSDASSHEGCQTSVLFPNARDEPCFKNAKTLDRTEVIEYDYD
jgi:hypothetical protein